jgi:hypothetical protein
MATLTPSFNDDGEFPQFLLTENDLHLTVKEELTSSTLLPFGVATSITSADISHNLDAKIHKMDCSKLIPKNVVIRRNQSFCRPFVAEFMHRTPHRPVPLQASRAPHTTLVTAGAQRTHTLPAHADNDAVISAAASIVPVVELTHHQQLASSCHCETSSCPMTL